MTAAYVPQVGDTVRHPAWPSETLAITAVGRDHLLAINEHGTEIKYVLSDKWVKVETPTPLPEWWINVYPSNIGTCFPCRADAQRYVMSERIAVLHIWTDADGVDHAEIERVTA